MSGDKRLMLEARKEGVELRYNLEKRLLDEFLTNFKEVFIGWEIEHSFRTPNKLGALVLKKEEFTIDKDFKVVNANK